MARSSNAGPEAEDKMETDHSLYNKIETLLQKLVLEGYICCDKAIFDAEMKKIHQRYRVDLKAIESFARNTCVTYVKRTTPSVRRRLPQLVEKFVNGQISLQLLSREVNYPPFLLTRMLLEVLTICNTPKQLRTILLDPSQILDDRTLLRPEFRLLFVDNDKPISDIVQEIRDILVMDPMYGPESDLKRFLVGVEYEVLLMSELDKLDIPYDSEAKLRGDGSSRTPDVLLSVPIAVRLSEDGTGSEEKWSIINWIDSKALFGDVNTHNTSVLPQAEAYVHRYGPGMVLYWFGHAPIAKLDSSDGIVLIKGWALPKTVLQPVSS